MKPTSEEFNYVHDIYKPDYNIQLKICNRETECYITIKTKKNNINLTPELIKDCLMQYKIIVDVDSEKIRTICQQVNSGQAVDTELIAQGTLPIPGHPAELNFFIKPFSFEPDFEEDEQGTIDFKQCNLFENVGIGRRIAGWKPAILGKNGQAVTGEVIPAKLVANFVTKAGRGIEERDNHEFYSVEKGRVILKDNELSISDEFVIDKNVDYSVGHVDFVGYVQVRGEVCDGFNINAKKGLRVYKNVGACTLQSGGDIEIGGMTGHDDDAIIKCDGNVTAKYLNNVDVECKGDVHIWKDIFNCTIRSKGQITVGGRIIGGLSIALGGLEAKQIGSDRGVNTKIIVGVDYHDIDKIEEWGTKLKETNTRWQEWCIHYDEAKHKINLNKWQLPDPEFVKKIFSDFNNIIEREKAIQSKLSAIRESYQDKANPKINFETQISAGTSVCVGNVNYNYKETLMGPKSLIEYGGYQLLELDKTALSKSAKELEQKIKERHAA